MKIRLLSVLIIVLLAQSSLSQKISPFYPDKAMKSQYNKYQTQITYLDFNFVNLNIQNYLSHNSYLTLEDTKYNFNKDSDTITEIFINGGINTKIRRLYFTFSVFPIGHDLVIKSLKITGDTNEVLRFYVFYWSTTLTFGELKKKETASNRFVQDRISYSFNGGKSSILIENTTIKSPKEFIKKFTNKHTTLIKQIDSIEKKYKIDEQQKIADRKKRAKIIQQKRLVREAKLAKKNKLANQKRKVEFNKRQEDLDKRLNTRRYVYTYTVTKKKKRLKFESVNYNNYANDVDLNKQFTKLLLGKKIGVYTFKIEYTLVYKVVESSKFEIIGYKKPRGLLNVVNDAIRY